VYTQVKCLFESHFEKKYFVPFPCYEKEKLENESPFPTIFAQNTIVDLTELPELFPWMGNTTFAKSL
jgi:hypothetical protein